MVQKRRRVLWAKAHLKLIVSKWKSVLWTDEYKFDILVGNNERRVLRAKKEWDLPACYWGSCGLMDRALDLRPEVTQGCGFESRLWQEVSMTEVRPLSKPPNPQLLPGRRNVGLILPTAPGVCALGWVKCREHISLLIILCIIVYLCDK